MIDTELLDRVRYPDENDGWYFDAIPYDKVIRGLKITISSAKGQLKIDTQDTLAELERRWEERQTKTKRIDVSAKKVTV